ncbi:DUF4174 domain-containing protein [Pareuzebyella sediminis]|uniref:DUF4174 domain-containing protein n=1 Tax=Pareuzebyella sediminis TaxID=2607998 RepID=UPI0011EDACD4|nr:DUF4174 domain-containing protein [Pareuzebyella sediminis]
MKSLPMLFLLVFCPLFTIKAQTWDDYQWKNRILILRDHSLEAKKLNGQLKVLQSNEKALKERDLLLFLIVNDGVYKPDGTKSPLSLEDSQSRWNYQTDFTGLLLIGKDGGVKLKRDFIVKPAEIFELIDGMPMRKAEMRNSKSD